MHSIGGPADTWMKRYLHAGGFSSEERYMDLVPMGGAAGDSDGSLGGGREHLGGAKTCFGAFLGTPGGWGGFVEARGSIPEQKPEIGKKNSTNNIGMLFPCCLF